MSVTAKLAELEAAKRAAVAAEDYDAAKAVKADIERVRASARVGRARAPRATSSEEPRPEHKPQRRSSTGSERQALSPIPSRSATPHRLIQHS